MLEQMTEKGRAELKEQKKKSKGKRKGGRKRGGKEGEREEIHTSSGFINAVLLVCKSIL